jgi:poly(beta-D-mannuronate) lyase
MLVTMLRFGIVLLVWLVPACADAQHAPLQSPWDSAPTAASDTPWDCPAAPSLPHDFATNSYYIDAQHSVIDPALRKKYTNSVAPIEGFSRNVVAAADAYRSTGSRAAAACVVTLLENAARQKALTGHMEGHQSSYVQGWNLGAWAVAWLKVRASGAASAERQTAILPWLKKLADLNRGYYEAKRSQRGSSDAHNNHLYWAGFAIAAAGIACNANALFEWGVAAYRQGVKDIQSDGALPLEMARGQMALHYHLYALAPLAMLAEFGAANGLDLYHEQDFAIRRLMERCVAGLEDPGFFQQRTGIAQVTTPQIDSWEISWAVPWTRRFPDAKISALLAKARQLQYTTLGGLPPP